jgi:hypothetical protein
MLGGFSNIRGEREREREHVRANEQVAKPSSSLSHWALFIGEVERFIDVLFPWWDEKL